MIPNLFLKNPLRMNHFLQKGRAIAVKSEIMDKRGWQLLELICRANIK
jgi:hypothetical protein